MDSGKDASQSGAKAASMAFSFGNKSDGTKRSKEMSDAELWKKKKEMKD